MSRVTLVGAGPGDMDLLTLRGRQCLELADCIIYDRLIDPKLLSFAKAGCEYIYVGKKAGSHSMKQQEINELLYQKAREYPYVVRLKGGDIYVFGRGGEEALYLRERGIDVDIVPGLSSCIAGLAYAGIPVTHRGISAGFHVYTAHGSEDEQMNLDFSAMLKDDQTYIFLMGLSRIQEICEGFLQAGKPEDTPMAVISHATQQQQETVISDILHMTEKLQEHPVSSPALIVVGNVVQLHEKLDFFKKRPLHQVQILLPSIGYGSALSQELRSLGAAVQEVQVGELVPLPQALDDIALTDFTHLLFTSQHAIRWFMEYLDEHDIDIRTLAHLKISVIGEASAKLLKHYGIRADIQPDTANSTDLWKILKQHLKPKDQLLYIKGQSESELSAQLRQLCSVREVVLYENREVSFDMQEETVQDCDFILFTCSSAVHRMMKKYKHAVCQRKGMIISIGATTSETLYSYGVEHVLQADAANYASLCRKVVEVWEEMKCIEDVD